MNPIENRQVDPWPVNPARLRLSLATFGHVSCLRIFGSPWTAQAPFAADHIQLSETSDEVVIETLAGETVGSVRFESRRPERLLVPWSRPRSLPPGYKMSEQAHIQAESSIRAADHG